MSFEASSTRSRAPEFQNVVPFGLRRTAGRRASWGLCASALVWTAQSAACDRPEKDGGLFSGGVKVSDAENATLGEISTALGV
jgi:hypothetical protein